MIDKPRDIVTPEGDVLPSYQDEVNSPVFHDEKNAEGDNNLEEDYLDDDIMESTARVIGQVASTAENNLDNNPLTSDQWLAARRDEREADLSGTFPGTSRPPTQQEIKEGQKVRKERERQIKLQKRIDAAISIVQRIRPETQDKISRAELTKAEEFLKSKGIDPEQYRSEY